VNPLDPPTRFGGLANFRALFHNPFVRQSAVNTVLYIVVGVALTTLFGLGIALVLQRRSLARGVILALVVLPWALPAVVEAVVWGWIYDPTFGVLNSVAHSLGLISTYHVWVGIGRVLSIVLIELVQVWQITPLAALLILAALQSIPQELYEAARVDGAGRWQMFRRITLPLIRPGLAVAMVEALILTLNVFDQVYVLNGFAPGGASIMLQTYQISFNNLNFGQGYALSLLATFATMLLSLLIIAVVYRRVEF
jgi:multiple sugar transport system permease protein